MRGSVIAAVAFGAAAGVAFGTYVLAPNLPGDGVGALRSEHSKQIDDVERRALVASSQADSADSLASDVADSIVDGKLKDKSVLLIRTSTAASEDVEAIRELVDKAGAHDTGVLELEADFLSAQGADKLKSIVANTLPAGAQLSEEQLSAGYHAGQALAAALTNDPDSGEARADENDREELLGALKEAGYVSYEGDAPESADAVIVVTGDSYSTRTNSNESEEDGGVSDNNLAAFVEAFDGGSGATVLAGRYSSADKDGALGIIRAGEAAETVSTVDSINRAFARISTVLALAEELDGSSGSYGAAENVTAAHPPLSTAEHSSESEETTDGGESEQSSSEQEDAGTDNNG